MAKKKFAKLFKTAKKNYSTNSQSYNRYLENKDHFIPLSSLVGTDYMGEHGWDPNMEQNPSDPNQPQNQDAQGGTDNTHIDGGNSAMPGINIVAKNYINPDAFDEDGEIHKKKKKSRTELSKIPDNLLKTSATEWEPINYRGVDEEYDLYGLSKVKIKYNEETQKIVYEVIEPELNEEELQIIEDLKKAFIYVFEKVSFDSINFQNENLIIEGTKKLCTKYGIKLTKDQFEKITYYLDRDFLGLEIIEPIMHDGFIEDVSCDGLNVPIFVNHLKYGALEVNRKFKDLNKLNSFIVKLAQKSNQEVSLSKPILQGALPEGSRVEAIYGKEISEKGSSFTIRKFRAEPFTPVHLMEFGTMPAFMLAYLWIAVENKQSLLVSGGTATGKTTILNALSLFVPPTSKIVSIEDTPEINLPHEHWLPLIARESEGRAEVSMFDLLKATLRERPDYIIVGEIRGKEAAILFQGMATGHAGLGTVHAEKFNDLVNRMTIAPINLPKQLLTELNLCIFMKTMKVKDNVVRRVNSVVEVVDYDSKEDKFETNEFVKFKPAEDNFEYKEKSSLVTHLIQMRGGDEEDIWTEIEKRRRILDFMHKNKILEFKEVSDIIKTYYKDPSAIFDYMENYKKKEKDVEEK
jgi:flagellar protein FlaI